MVAGLSGSSFVLIAGGRFTTIGGVARPNIARIGPDTGLPYQVWDAHCDGNVTALTLTSGSLYVGGAFQHIGGATRAFLAALNPTTAQATDWAPQVGGVVQSIASSNGKTFVGGAFTTPRQRVAGYDNLGNLLSWSANANNTVYALGIIGSTLYMGGDFTLVGGQSRVRLAAVGTQTPTLTAWNPGADSTVRTLALSGTSMFVGGSFTNVGGKVRRGAAAIDGTTAKVVDWNPNFQGGPVRVICRYGPNVCVGGNFTSVSGVLRAHLAVLGNGARTTDVTPVIAGEISLGPVSPNPLHSRAMVRFTIAQTAKVSLALFDVAGRRARTLVDETLSPGVHEATISRDGLEPGIYFLRLGLASQKFTRKVLIVP